MRKPESLGTEFKQKGQNYILYCLIFYFFLLIVFISFYSTLKKSTNSPRDEKQECSAHHQELGTICSCTVRPGTEKAISSQREIIGDSWFPSMTHYTAFLQRKYCKIKRKAVQVGGVFS
jgi:hypothetical protein